VFERKFDGIRLLAYTRGGDVQLKEVERRDVEPQTFTIRSTAARVHNVGDVWNDMRRRCRSLKRAIEKLKRLDQR
jgi:DNA primase